MWSALRRFFERRSQQTQQRKAMECAIFRGDLGTVVRLLDAGVSPDLAIDGVTLIVFAITQRKSDIVAALLESGARLSGPGNERLLSRSALRGDTVMVRRAINAGGSVNARPRHGLTPLEEAVRSNNLEMIDLLMQLGAKPADLRYVRWFGVRADTIRKMASWGIDVPCDVMQAVQEGKWL
jgi:ankyrin repeat protein